MKEFLRTCSCGKTARETKRSCLICYSKVWWVQD